MIRTKACTALILAGVLLSSCNNKSDSEAPFAADVGGETANQEDKFGKGFGEAFRADPNSEPANVSQSDVEAVSYTADPEPID